MGLAGRAGEGGWPGQAAFVAASLLCLAALASGAEPDPPPALAVRTYSADSGLPQNTVNALLQDRHGFLWAGTENGVSRFDGYRFTAFPRASDRSDGPRQLVISAFYEDASGVIWIGSANGELDRYDPAKETFTPFPTSGTSSGRATIRALHEDRRGRLWVATWGAGLLRIDAERRGIARIPAGEAGDLLGDWTLSLLEDRDGAVWVGTESGLLRIDPATDAMQPVVAELPRSEGRPGVFSLHEDEGGLLWAGTAGGWLLAVDRRRGAVTGSMLCAAPEAGRVRDHRVIATFEDPAHGLWAATSRGGLYRVDRTAGRCVALAADTEPGGPAELADEFVNTAVRDQAGNLWLGTLTSGIKHVYRRKAFRSLSPDVGRGAAGAYVWAVLEDRAGTLWAGTEGEGLFSRSPGARRFERRLEHASAGQGPGTVWSLLEDRHGELWVGLRGGGLYRLDPTRTRVRHYPSHPEAPHALRSDRVRSLYEDPAGTLWLATGTGLHRFDRGTDRFESWLPEPGPEPAKAARNNLNALAMGSDGRLWVGTRSGLLLFDPAAGRFAELPEVAPAALRLATIRALLAGADGSIWIGTHGGGVLRAAPSARTFTRWGQAEGLSDQTVYGLAEDRLGRVWLSTNRGLSCLDPVSGQIRNYDAGDGLQANEFNAGAVHRHASGRLSFGGVRGITVFQPDEIVDDRFVPPVRITGLRLNNQPVPLGPLPDGRTVLEGSLLATPVVRLSHRDRMIGFEYVGLGYVRPERIAYAYRLEGFDEDWVRAGSSRVATYTNLRPGSYVFRARAANSDGVWNEAGASVAVDIPTPFWLATWFRVGLALAVGLTVVGLVRRRLRHAERRSDALAVANQRLAQSLARWRSLVENAPVTVLSVSPELRVEFVNAGPTEAAGLVGRPVLELLGETGGASPARDALVRTLGTGEPTSILLQAPAIGGPGQAWYRVRVGAVREESRITGLTLICVDVSEQRLVQEEREKLIGELEQRNAELERFTFTVSHDLRSPLVTVRGFLGYAEKELAEGAVELAAEDFARMRTATDTMDRLLRELLELSRIGRVASPREAVPLARVAEEAARLVDGRLRERGVRLEIRPDLPVLFGERARLVELLQNLLDNAAKFMGTQPEPRVVVGARPEPEGPVCYVRDNGIGIAPRFRDKVFGIFERLDPAVEGTGVGLAIAKRIVEAHGGRIWVESEGEGRGSSICFTLPPAPAEASAPG